MHRQTKTVLALLMCSATPILGMQKTKVEHKQALLQAPTLVQIQPEEAEDTAPQKTRSWFCCRSRKTKLVTAGAATAVLVIAGVSLYNKASSVMDTINTVQTDVATASADIRLTRKAFETLVALLNKTKNHP